VLTQEKLKELLAYDSETGLFKWCVRVGKRIHVGSIAGHLDEISGYIRITVQGKIYQAHRLAWLYVHGYFPETDVGHINKVRHDNRIENLREASRQCINIRRKSD